MERTINCEGKDYLSNLAKVIVNSKWKSCLRKLRKLSKVQKNLLIDRTFWSWRHSTVC